MKDLQAIIDARATKKLMEDIDGDLIKYLEFVDYGEFAERFNPVKYRDWTLREILSNSPGRWVKEKIRSKLIEKRIEDETVGFLKDIENILSSYSNLENEIRSLNTKD